MTIRKELLDILACPKCKGDVEDKDNFLLCRTCSMAFPILDDVPDMLIEDAWTMERAKKAGFRHNLVI